MTTGPAIVARVRCGCGALVVRAALVTVAPVELGEVKLYTHERAGRLLHHLNARILRAIKR